MSSFHDNKLWQEAYVAALDATEVVDASGGELGAQIKHLSLHILTTLADSLTRRDRREAEGKMRDAGGLVAAVRSLLSVAWAQNQLTDEQFGKLDSSYENLSKSLR
ncbi:four helix bundle protein [Candidatus Gottesmanbacteria bacterium]|nr:four helix bundle protein [Candidatus Gottesmanbacteria bacterium]